MSVSKLVAVSAALLLALGLPLAAGAKEESKIQVLLSGSSGPSNGSNPTWTTNSWRVSPRTPFRSRPS
jgi:hypothetical protein